MAKNVAFKGKTETAFDGEKLSKPLPYSGVYDTHDNAQSVRDAGEWPSEADIVDMVNAKALAAAKAKAKSKALVDAGYAKPDLSDPAYRRKRMIADFVAMNVPVEIATQQVDAILKAAQPKS